MENKYSNTATLSDKIKNSSLARYRQKELQASLTGNIFIHLKEIAF